MALSIATHVTLPRTGQVQWPGEARAEHAADASGMNTRTQAVGAKVEAVDRSGVRAASEQSAMQSLDRVRQLDDAYGQVKTSLMAVAELAKSAVASDPAHEQTLTRLVDALARHAAGTANPELPAFEGGELNVKLGGSGRDRSTSITLPDLDAALYGETGLAQIRVNDVNGAAGLQRSAGAALADLHGSEQQLHAVMTQLEHTMAALDGTHPSAGPPTDASLAQVAQDLRAMPREAQAELSRTSPRALLLLEEP